ncbi:hypothetical protein COJ96_06785 [Bacillus sp. AFS073361]|uniref:hypothetical protein n=1 Tax=Bacillus sp. AFS073361 TaxID=2033511 RepID=UPI000BF45454|nr:hypothetical protein [Bacillus sp. AFS073361]PFP30119.1 hypothetical protein COJ96_06785 [Bacillus sp. AFS073361]
MSSAKVKREIIGLALLLDEVSDYTVFFDYSPHVSELSVSVRKNKEEWKLKVFEGKFYYDFHREEDEGKYLRIKEFLETEIKNLTEIKGGV